MKFNSIGLSTHVYECVYIHTQFKCYLGWSSLVAQMVEDLPAMQDRFFYERKMVVSNPFAKKKKKNGLSPWLFFPPENIAVSWKKHTF